MAGSLGFSLLTKLFTDCTRIRKSQEGWDETAPTNNLQRELLMARFRKTYMQNMANEDILEVYRLILPGLDTRIYEVQESRLITALIRASDWPTTNQVSVNTMHANFKAWRPMTPSGDFVTAAKDHIFVRNCPVETSKTLTIRLLNMLLNELAETSVAYKHTIFKKMMRLASSSDMTWIFRIVLKVMNVGLTTALVLEDFRQGSFTEFSKTQCLLTTLHDDAELSHKSRVFRACNPQCSTPVNSFREAASHMPSEFIVEVKFDGERLQLHREGEIIKYFSRSNKENSISRSYGGLAQVAFDHLADDKVILDGELVLWDKQASKFLRQSDIYTVLNLAKANTDWEDGKFAPKGGLKDVEVIYVIFDVLHTSNLGSVMHLPLSERHKILATCLKPGVLASRVFNSDLLTGRFVTLLPKTKIFDGMGKLADIEFSKIASCKEDIQKMLDLVVGRNEEGLVIKNPSSPWGMGDRSKNWLKLKLDYVKTCSIDCVIVGECKTKNAEKYMFAIADDVMGNDDDDDDLSDDDDDKPLVDNTPKFSTFCCLVTGFSVADKIKVRETLDAIGFMKMPGSAPPSNVNHVTKTPVYRWVNDPMKSIVVEVAGEARILKTSSYACGYTLKFPKIIKIREDKSPEQVNTVEMVRDLFKSQGTDE